ncbi:hypothetical protein O6H91_01G023500 [Diphasiastrum complanatum]|uniref:Uncharacterized protein n=2 Tax=Diphasiastrum complanatum TaxID=34168 RepID=A0ACC2ENZ4_DIPCM|nr:hypothetical protein O6H91_01G023500 [Diphasiastrum complanatum]
MRFLTKLVWSALVMSVMQIELMLTGPRPVEAMHLLVELDLFSTVFKPPPNLADSIPDNWPRLCVSCMEMVLKTLDLFGSTKLLTEQKKLCFLSALFWPLRDVTVAQKKNRQIRVSSIIIRESLKLKVSDGDAVLALHDAAKEFIKITVKFSKGGDDVANNKRDFGLNGSLQSSHEADMRVQLGLLLMKIRVLWRSALVISSILQDQMDYSWILDGNGSLEAAKHCIEFENLILRLGLENIWELKPLLDGQLIMEVLGLQNGGPQIKEFKDRAFRWQLAHPTATVKECLDWFQEEHSKRIKTQ